MWHTPPDQAAAQDERPAIATGVFDLVHVGHVRFLTAAAQSAAYLLVGVEDDERVRAWKGSSRPVVCAEDRAAVLAALRVVDGVFLIHGSPEINQPDDYIRLLAPLRPAVLAHTRGDPFAEGRRQAAKALDAEAIEIPFVPGRSTTRMLKRLGKA